MGRSRVTIDAPVLASAIRIQTRFKADIRTGIPGDNRSRSIAKILRRTPRRVFGLLLEINDVNVGQVDVQFFESVRRAPRRAAPTNGSVALRRFFNNRYKFPARHVSKCSREHVACLDLFEPANARRPTRLCKRYGVASAQHRTLNSFLHSALDVGRWTLDVASRSSEGWQSG